MIKKQHDIWLFIAMYWQLTVIALISFTTRTFGQPLPVPHGTLIVTIVCTDGILVASDSRASWKDDNKILFAYADGFKKVFQI
ncbi:MAG TPA: hypothetical protein VJU78_17810, partial [Chitinophagaceae bacterium]|nr:hypothetical protein [Chitinophagaceae bacterium]